MSEPLTQAQVDAFTHGLTALCKATGVLIAAGDHGGLEITPMPKTDAIPPFACYVATVHAQVNTNVVRLRSHFSRSTLLLERPVIATVIRRRVFGVEVVASRHADPETLTAVALVASCGEGQPRQASARTSFAFDATLAPLVLGRVVHEAMSRALDDWAVELSLPNEMVVSPALSPAPHTP